MFYPVNVKYKKKETKDSVTIGFEVSEAIKDKFKYSAGQFIGIKALINGEEVIRSYSFSTEPSEDLCAITIKKIENGRMSTYLVDKVDEGQVLLLAPPAGKLLPDDGVINGHQYTFFAAGSGVTPMYSIMKAVLKETNSKVDFHYLNKTKADVIFYNELLSMQDKYKEQLSVSFLFSKEAGGSRPNQESLSKAVALKGSFYMCGPEGYMETIETFLASNGVGKERIHKESFAAPVAKKGIELGEGTIIGDTSSAKATDSSSIKIICSGEEKTIAWDSNFDSILEQLVSLDVDVPFSCMNGACMACMCKVTTGAVIQEDLGILTSDNVQEKESLSCQAVPASKELTLNFDDI